MGFDDLARHIAARDGRKSPLEGVVGGDADQLVARAISEDRRLTRMRNLILGPLLILGGLGVALLVLSAFQPDEGSRSSMKLLLVAGVAGVAAIGIGVKKTLAGIRNDANADDLHPLDPAKKLSER